jgi:transposase
LFLISRSQRKSDRHDAETLARLARVDVPLLRPVQHRTLEQQADLELMHARDALVRSRTLQVNHVRSALKAFGLRVPDCDATNFHVRARPCVPQRLEKAILPLLRTIRALTETIQRYDREVKRLAEKVYSHSTPLRQVDGVGDVTSLAYVLVLGDPKRFRRARQVGAYIGLTPAMSQSGESNPQCHISKAGNGYLRRLLVQAAHYILGPFGPDTRLRRIGERLQERGGARGKKRAVVAVARHLSVLLFHLWRTGEAYDPLRGAPALPPKGV